MEKFTVEQRVQIIKIHYKNSENFAETVRKTRTIFGHHNAPSRNTVVNLINKFESTGSVVDAKRSGRPRSGRSDENIAMTAVSVDDDPTTSIRHRGQELGISSSSLQLVLAKDLHLHPYKVQLTQKLKPADHAQRRTFSDWVLEHHQVDHDFAEKIIFSDEAHFHLNGYVNKQNCRIWGTENPRALQELPMHPQRCTVWCGFWAGGVIGPFFFENAAGTAVTVNGARYRDMLTNSFWPEIADMDLDDMWFQQDGATCHTANDTIELLQTKFEGKIISCRGDVNWPPRSCDLTPLDFFLWGFLKGKVYANKPRTIPELKQEIQLAIAAIEPQLCQNVIENFMKRAHVCKQARGGHLSDIMFHQ